jgi:hypothetical protein
MKKKNLKGIRFGRLMVLSESKTRIRKHVAWNCLCECGKKIIVIGCDLTRKATRSCGCLRTELRRERFKKLFLGVKRSRETRRKMSLAQMGNKKWLGKKHTDEERRKIGLGNIGKIVSEESRKKLSEALKGNVWTLERRLEWSKRKKGEGNNNWKGGITEERKAVRSGWRYRLWSEKVRRRDGKCQDCGSKENLHAHHKERFLVNIERQYDVDNGITLCASCHYKYHQGDGAYSHGKINLEERANIA